LYNQVVLARAEPALGNPAILRFATMVAAPVQVVAGGCAIRRLEIAPVNLPSGPAKSALEATGAEPIDGPPGSYIAYVDDKSYPEGGVYWTRDIQASHVELVPNGGRELHLVLHVGPDGGPVAIEIGEQPLQIDMKPNETRDISAPLPSGRSSVGLTVRASRPFRPSQADPSSDDGRMLGCQVRPRIR
jgi:hypothetical protein